MHWQAFGQTQTKSVPCLQNVVREHPFGGFFSRSFVALAAHVKDLLHGRMIVLVAIPDAPEAKFLEKRCISVIISRATVELELCGDGIDMKKTCPSCNGTGSVYGLGGSGPAGGANTMLCNVCYGTGMVEDYSLPEPDGDGNKLPFLVTVVATLCGLGAGYLSYQNSSFAGGYDKMMTAILFGVFAFIAVGILFKILTNPLRALMYFTVVWALDYFLLGRTLELFIRNLFST